MRTRSGGSSQGSSVVPMEVKSSSKGTASMNPYLSFAAVLAAGLEGIDRRLAPPPPIAGSAYGKELPTVPGDLGEATALFAGSALAAQALTPAVHAHLVALARKERDEHRRAVTGWQLRRYFDTA